MDKVQARLAAIGRSLGGAQSVTVGNLNDGPTYPARESQAQTDSNADRASMGVAPAESPSKPVSTTRSAASSPSSPGRVRRTHAA